MALKFDVIEDTDLCSECFDDEEYVYGLCVGCAEELLAEMDDYESF